MWNVNFWMAACERSVKTFAQTAVALIGVDAVVSVTSIDWPYIVGVAATSSVLSILSSVASSPVGDWGTPSLIKEVK